MLVHHLMLRTMATMEKKTNFKNGQFSMNSLANQGCEFNSSNLRPSHHRSAPSLAAAARPFEDPLEASPATPKHPPSAQHCDDDDGDYDENHFQFNHVEMFTPHDPWFSFVIMTVYLNPKKKIWGCAPSPRKRAILTAPVYHTTGELL